jgi:hypothetical protein
MTLRPCEATAHAGTDALQPMSGHTCQAGRMELGPGRKPLLTGRGGVLIADLCLSTGLDREP